MAESIPNPDLDKPSGHEPADTAQTGLERSLGKSAAENALSGDTVTFSGPKDLVGSTLGEHYQVLEILGEGAMGIVFKARDKAMDRPVALKVLLPHLLSNGKSWVRFQQEAKAAGRINHPNCITIYSSFVDRGLLCIVMELVEGLSLSAIIKEQGALSLERSLKIAEQTCDVLTAAHRLGIYHRDLKPSNLMISSDCGAETVKVVDFGIAKIASEDGSTMGTLTETGSPIGSPQYMSPEQWSAASVDQRSDIYSLGCVFYECLVGEPPFKAQGVLGLMKQHLEDEPPRFPEWLEGNKAQLLAAFQIAQVALAKVPSERYQTAEEFKAALSFCRESSPGNQRFFRKIQSRTKKSGQRRILLLLEGLIAGAVSITVGVLLWTLKDAAGSVPTKVDRDIPLQYVVLRAPLLGGSKLNSHSNSASRPVFGRIGEKDDLSLLYPLARKAGQYLEAGDYQKAAEYFQGVENICLKNGMSGSDEILQASLDHAECLIRMGFPKFALSPATFAVNAAGVRAPEGAYAMLANGKLGEIAELLGNKRDAFSRYDRFGNLLRSDNEEKCFRPIDLTFTESSAGKFFMLNNENSKAASMLSKAAAMWSKAKIIYPSNKSIARNLSVVENDLGLALAQLGKYQDARSQFQLALDEMSNVDSQNDLNVSKILLNLSDLDWMSTSLMDKFGALQKRSSGRALWLKARSDKQTGPNASQFSPAR